MLYHAIAGSSSSQEILLSERLVVMSTVPCTAQRSGGAAHVSKCQTVLTTTRMRPLVCDMPWVRLGSMCTA